MGHEIMNSVMALGRKTFWHKLNIVGDYEVVPALERMTYPEYRTVQMSMDDPFTGKPFDAVNDYAIFRSPMTEKELQEGRGIRLGRVVTNQFRIIQPMEAAEAIDEVLRLPDGSRPYVDAMGFLGDGERMWITFRTPEWDVNIPGGGTVPHENYLLFWNPFMPDSACRVLYTTVCVVCHNTSLAALDAATIDIPVTHSQYALNQLREALATVWFKGQVASEEAQENMNHLAKKTISDPDAKRIIEDIFTMPNPPKVMSTAKSSYEERHRNWQRVCNIVEQKRDVTWQLYGGTTEYGAAGATNQLPGVAGTAFGLYNAFTALSSHMKGNADTALYDFVEGDRGRFTKRALETLLAY